MHCVHPRLVALVAVFFCFAGAVQAVEASGEPSLAERFWQVAEVAPEDRRGFWGSLFNPGTTASYCSGSYDFPPLTLAPTTDPATLPVEAEADEGSYQIGVGASLRGDVRLKQGDRTLRSPTAEIDLRSGQAAFSDTLLVSEPGFILEGQSAKTNINTRETVLQGVELLLNPAQFRGVAGDVALDTQQNLEVSSAVLTRCPPGNESWRISAGHLRIDQGAKSAAVRQAVLRVGRVPIFYAPYLRFPINSERQSGWLFPALAYSAEDGTDFALPYYFNLAPNYDLTVTPRLVSERGLGVEAEGRHLSRYGLTNLGGAFLPSDDLYNGELDPEDFREQFPGETFEPADRWLYGMTHAGGVELPVGRLRTFVDYTAASDADYFRDLGSDLGVSSRVELQRLGEVVYQHGGFEARAWAQRFQVLDPDIVTPYQRLPELAVNYEGALLGPLRWSSGVAWSVFDRDTDDLTGLNAVTGSRLHANPRLELPLVWPFGFLSVGAGYQYTRYDLDVATTAGLSAAFDDRPTREVPFGRIDGGLIFERPLNLFGASMVQTLEPRLYYLHQDFEDQSELPRFDSTPLTFQYRQLFRENRFSGVDRIGDANQLSVGVTSRVLDGATGQERFRVSVGQIRYFEDRRVTFSGAPIDGDLQPGSAIATELAGSVGGALSWRGVVLWDPHDNEVDEGSVNLGWRSGSDKLVNLGYRQRVQGDVEQTDFSAYWPINRHFRVLGRWNYDLRSGRTIEGLGGIEYNDCCWKIRLVARRFIDSRNVAVIDTVEADEGIELQIVFRGLAGFGNRLESILERSIAGYQPEDGIPQSRLR